MTTFKTLINAVTGLTLLILLATPPLLAQTTPIAIAVDSAYPPYMYGTTPAKGIYPEIIRAAFQEYGIPVAVIGYPWKRALTMGKEGKVAVGGIYQNLERLKIFDFSDPLFTETLVVCVKKGRRFTFRGMIDLKGKRVGINRGWSYGEVFDTARRSGLLTADETADNLANLKKLLMDRVDCIIAETVSLHRILNQKGWRDQIDVLDPPAAVNSAYLVFAKHARQSHLLETFNLGLFQIRENGTYHRIMDTFFQGAPQQNRPQ